MIRKLLIILFAAFIASASLEAQETLKTMSLSADFSGFAGTPRVVRNGFKRIWVVVWRQQGNPAKLIGRIVQSDGTAGPPKTLASGVNAFEGAFDFAYDTIAYTYLLAFENAKGLQVQFFNANFAKVGQPSLIEAGVSNSSPRLAYDPVGKKFLIFYVSSQDGVARRVFKSMALDAIGKPAGAAVQLSTAPAGRAFGFLSVSTNHKSGNLLALIMRNTTNAPVKGELLGYAVKPDGGLLKAAALKMQPPTAGLNAFGDSSFADDGTGFALWADRLALKFRKISSAMGFAGPAKSIAGGADVNSIATALTLDSRNGQYLAVWTKANQVMSAALHTATGAVVKQPFEVAGSALTNARNSASSYDPSQGNVLVVWEDSSIPASAATAPDTKFRIRAAIFFVAGSTSASGVMVGDNFFSPAQLRIQTGTTVKWNFSGNNQHTVSANGNAFDSGTLNRGANFEFRFTRAGTFPYFCRIHGQSMSGTITVVDEGEPPDRY